MCRFHEPSSGTPYSPPISNQFPTYIRVKFLVLGYMAIVSVTKKVDGRVLMDRTGVTNDIHLAVKVRSITSLWKGSV
jgi:hypothetical protein